MAGVTRRQQAGAAQAAAATASSGGRSLRSRETDSMRASRKQMRESSDEGEEDASSDGGDTGDDSDGDFDADPDEIQVPKQRATARKSTSPKSLPNRKRSAELKSSNAKRRATPIEMEKRGVEIIVAIPQKQQIPDWQNNLEMSLLWLDIFTYASTDGYNRDTAWLARCARVCKMFMVPALEALYRETTMPAKPKRLKDLLAMDPSKTMVDYRKLIHSFEVDVRFLPAGSCRSLIRPMTNLKELSIETEWDRPPYHNLTRTLRWAYPEELFQSLDADDDPKVEEVTADDAAQPETMSLRSTKEAPVEERKTQHTTLRSWSWSGRMFGSHVRTLGDIIAIHNTKPFRELRKLTFINFNTPTFLTEFGLLSQSYLIEPGATGEEKDDKAASTLAEAISSLKYLKHLTFEACTILDDRLMPLLPQNLQYLSLINCWEVTSDTLGAFLIDGGNNLRGLSLMHCQSLDLEFLPELGYNCPELREFRIDLSCYSLNASAGSADPMYDQALTPEFIPDWPTKLQVIEISHLKKLQKDKVIETAEMLLQSLINKADELKDLRHLMVKMMLDVSWKDRAHMRTKWASIMNRVFLRPVEDPSGYTKRPTDANPITHNNNTSSKDKKSSSSRRRSARHQSPSTHRRSTRTRTDYREPDTDEEDIPEEGTLSKADAEDEDSGEWTAERVQGMCETVLVQFDNQKPAELQFGFEDFQDEGTDTEDEWNGEDPDVDESYAF